MAQLVGHVPMDVVRTGGFKPCEACSLKFGKYRVSLDPPGTRARVKHYLCGSCAPGVDE